MAKIADMRCVPWGLQAAMFPCAVEPIRCRLSWGWPCATGRVLLPCWLCVWHMRWVPSGVAALPESWRCPTLPAAQRALPCGSLAAAGMDVCWDDLSGALPSHPQHASGCPASTSTPVQRRRHGPLPHRLVPGRRAGACADPGGRRWAAGAVLVLLEWLEQASSRGPQPMHDRVHERLRYGKLACPLRAAVCSCASRSCPPPLLPPPAGQTSLAYVTAATHGLVEDAERLGEQLGELRPRVDAAHGEASRLIRAGHCAVLGCHAVGSCVHHSSCLCICKHRLGCRASRCGCCCSACHHQAMPPPLQHACWLSPRLHALLTSLLLT